MRWLLLLGVCLVCGCSLFRAVSSPGSAEGKSLAQKLDGVAAAVEAVRPAAGLVPGYGLAAERALGVSAAVLVGIGSYLRGKKVQANANLLINGEHSKTPTKKS